MKVTYGPLKFSVGSYHTVSIDRDTVVNGRPVFETAGYLTIIDHEYLWALPEEAFAAAYLTSKEVTCILGLLNWLNSQR